MSINSHDSELTARQRSDSTRTFHLGCLTVGALFLLATSVSGQTADSAPGAPGPLTDPRIEVERVETLPDDVANSADFQRFTIPKLAEALAEIDERTEATRSTVAFLESATYRAQVSNTELLNGECEFEVSRRGGAETFLDWSSSNIALHDLRWEDRRAVWGAAPDGRQLLFVDRPQGLLTAGWSRRGEAILDRVTFDIQLPAAMRSTLILQVRDRYTLESSSGLVRPPEPAPERGWNLWTIDLGRRSECRIRIGVTASDRAHPLLACETATVYSVRRDGLHLQADYAIEVHDAPLPEVTFEVPRGVENVTATLNGVPISTTRESVKGAQLLHVRIHDLPLGQRGSIRIRGFAPIRWSTGMPTLPRVELRDGLVLGETLSLIVERPLEVQDIRASGWRQMSLSADDAREIWSFRATDFDPSIAVSARFPPTALDCHVLALADLRGDEARVTSQVRLKSKRGAAYEWELELPLGWRVQSVQSRTGDTPLSYWDTRSFNGRQSLRVEFQQSLTGPVEHQLTIVAGARRPSQGDRFELPVLYPVGAEHLSVDCLVVVDSFHAIEVATDSAFQLVSSPSADQTDRFFTTLPPAGTARKDTGRKTLFRWDGGDEISRPTLSLTRSNQSDAEGNTLTPAPLDSATVVPPGPPTTGEARSSDVPLDGPAHAFVRLTTTTAPRDSETHVHEVLCEFDRLMTWSELTFELAEPARLSAVTIDGDPVTITRDGSTVRFPPGVRPGRLLQFVYITPAPQGGIYRLAQVPLPRLPGAASAFEWQLELTDSQRLIDISLPTYLANLHKESSPYRRWLGPLGRSTSDPPFNPFSISAWKQLVGITDESATPEEIPRHIVTIAAPQLPSSVNFVIWDTGRSSAWSWVCLFGSLLVMVGARKMRASLIRRLAIPWLCGLAALSWLVDVGAGQLLGGVFVGSFLACLIPRRIVRAGNWFSRSSEPSSPPVPQLAGLLLFLSVLSVSGIRSNALAAQSGTDTPPPSTSLLRAYVVGAEGEEEIYIGNDDWSALSKSATANRPPYLIESARYELTRGHRSASVNGTFTVLRLRSDDAVSVRLPLQGVTFRDGAECTVNGTIAPLIPTADGSAVVVTLPARNRVSSDDEATADAPEEAASDDANEIDADVIHLKFLLRPSSESSSTSVTFRAVVPTIMQSILDIDPESVFPGEDWSRSGSRMLLADGHVRYELGRSGELAVHLDPAQQALPFKSAEVLTQVELLPLHYRCRSLISLPTAAWTSGRPVTIGCRLPESALVRSVTGAALTHWSVTRSAGSQTLVEFRLLRSAVEKEPVQLDFVVPWPDAVMNDVRQVRALQIEEVPTKSYVNVVAPPGVQIELHNSSDDTTDLRTISADQWRELAPSSWVPGTRIVQLGESPQFGVTLRGLRPRRSVSIDEAVTLTRRKLNWTANIRMEVADVPAFRHVLRLDPQIELEDVAVEQDGAKRLIRWNRTEDRLALFLEGENLGTQSITIRGFKPLPPDVDVSIPRIRVEDATQSSGIITFTDRTGWAVALKPRDPDKPNLVSASSAEADRLPRSIGEFRYDVPAIPTRLRLSPGADAARAESVVRIVPSYSGPTQIVTMMHVEGIEVPLRRVTIRVPPELAGQTRILPSRLQALSTGPDRQPGEIELIVPPRNAEAITFSVTFPIKDLPMGTTVPTVEVTSAQQASRFVLLDRSVSGVIPVSQGARTNAASLPDWVPAPWQRAARSSAVDPYVLIDDEFSLIARPISVGVEIPLAETVIWSASEGVVSGTTQFFAVGDEPTTLKLILPDEVAVSSATLNGREPLSLQETESDVRIPLEANDSITSITVHWRALAQPGAPLSLPQLQGAEELNHVVAVAGPPHFTVDVADHEPRTRVDAWIARWTGLLDCLERLRGTLTFDHLILNGIRSCQRELSRWAQTHPRSEFPDKHKRIDELERRWSDIQSELIVAASFDAIDDEATGFAADPILRAQPSSPQLAWLVSKQQIPSVSIALTQSSAMRIGQRLLVLCGIVIVGILGQWILLRTEVRELLGRHTGLGLVLLGTFWWAWLTPSILGVVFVVTGLIVHFVRWVRPLLAPNNTASPTPGTA